MDTLFKNFTENGFVILKDFLSNKFLSDSYKELKEETLLEFSKLTKNDMGGFISGNLNVFPGKYSQIFLDALLENNLGNIIEKLSQKTLSEFNVLVGGNLNQQYSYNQHFHTDGGFNNEFLIVNLATEDVTELNGPLEIAPGTHKNDLPYWKFVVHKKRKRILLSRGDIIIRSSALWHRGTKNISRKPRFLLAFTFRDKNKSELNSDNFNQININGSKS
jgi:hypothetical protein